MSFIDVSMILCCLKYSLANSRQQIPGQHSTENIYLIY